MGMDPNVVEQIGMDPSMMDGMMGGVMDPCMLKHMGIEPNMLEQIGMDPSMMAGMRGGMTDPC
eukprot:14163952-Alexandrium_andersonii.AAC.1